MAEHAVGGGAATDCLQQLVRQRIIRPREPNRVGRNHGKLHPSRNRNQATIDQLFGGVAMERELHIQPTGVKLHQPAGQAIGFDGLRWIGRMLDRA